MPFMYSCNTKEQQLGRTAGAKPLQLFLFHLINGLAQRIPARTQYSELSAASSGYHLGPRAQNWALNSTGAKTKSKMLQLAFNTFNSLLNLGEVEDRVIHYFEIFYLYAVVV